MALLLRKILIAVGAVVSVFHVVCAMGLFSSIIIWLSLQFTAALPAAMAFVIGIPCLACVIASILMFGIKEKATIFTVVYIILGVFVVVAGISIMSPFIQLYTHERSDLIGDFCSDCNHLGAHTLQCVDGCHDECCFTNFSAPLSRAFIAFTAISLVASIASIVVGILNLLYIYKHPQNTDRKTH